MPLITQGQERKRGRRWLLVPPIILFPLVVVTAVHWITFEFGAYRIEVGGMPAWVAAQDLEVKTDGFYHARHGENTISAIRFAGYAYVLVRSRVR